MYSPIKTINIARLIKEAVDLNILCFDCDAQKGRLSKRLIYIMMHVIDLNKLEKPTHIFVSPSKIPDLSEIAGHYNPQYVDRLKVWHVDGLDYYDDYNPKNDWRTGHGRHLKYFNSLNGCLTYDKTSLIMMGTKEKVLLGCY